jgi:hypothetical protein
VLTAVLFLFINSNQILSADNHQKKSELVAGTRFDLYISYLETQKIGYVDLEFAVTNKSSGQKESEVIISVIASHKDEKFVTFALNTPSTPHLFKCVFDIEESGVWIFTADVSQENYQELFQFTIEVEERNRKTNPFSESFFLFILIFLIIVTIPLFVFRKTIFYKSN